MLGIGAPGSRPLGYFGSINIGTPSWAAFPFTFTAKLDITSTAIIQLPIDCVVSGDQPYEIGKEWDVRAPNLKAKVMARLAAVRQLSGDKPSFSVRSTSRGYE